MDSIEVQEFLMTATGSDSILLETDRIFEKTTDPNNSTQSSMYYSINDDTLSNRLVDDLQRMERTLTDVIEEDSEQKTVELSSVIMVTHNNETPEQQDEEMSFQQNLPLKSMVFPNQHMSTQCSTPKLEIVAKKKTPQVDFKKLDASLTVPAPDVLMPLTKLLEKMEGKKKVTIAEETENKENVEEEPQSKQAKIDEPRKTVTIAENDPQPKKSTTGAVPKRPLSNLRKSMIPSAPSTGTIKDVPVKSSRPSMIAPRKSVRLSVAPPTHKSSRLTVGGGIGKSGKLSSPASIKMKKFSSAAAPRPSILTSRMTINNNKAVVDNKAQINDEKVKKRLSRIPPPNPVKPASSTTTSTTTAAAPGAATSVAIPSSYIRPVFTCNICKKSFHLKSTLATHQKIHAATTSSASGASAPITGGHFKCTFCDKDFEKEVGLRNHVEKYCEKVPIAEKRKMSEPTMVTHNRTRTRTTSAEIRDRSKKDKSGSSKLESTSSSIGSEASGKDAQKTNKAADAQPPAPASGLSPKKPIKSIIQPHSGVKFTANKPITCFQCKTTFNKYVDFHLHVDEMHPQPLGSPGVTMEREEAPVAQEEEGEKKD